MIKCTGIHCPVQFDPTSDFTPSACKITDTCKYATPLTDDQINVLLFTLLYAMFQKEEYKQIQECLAPPPVPSPGPYIVESSNPCLGCHFNTDNEEPNNVE